MPPIESTVPTLTHLGRTFRLDEALTAAPRPTLDAPCSHVRQVIKHGRVFVVSHTDGQIHPGCTCGQGVYMADTRFLSGSTWRLGNHDLVLLASEAEHNFFSRADYVNPALVDEMGREVRRETIHLRQTRLVDGGVHERLEITNYNPFPVKLRLVLEVRADYQDMFEVRGFGSRRAAGRFLETEVEPAGFVFGYQGTDGVLRETEVRFVTSPEFVALRRFLETRETGAEVAFRVELGPGRSGRIDLGLLPREDAAEPAPFRSLDWELDHLERRQQQAIASWTSVHSTNPAFDQFLNRGILDLIALTTELETGPYLVAGTPWYACPFGRDGLITAYQALMLDPSLAEGTLRYLAKHQGTEEDPSCDEEPGKILHESRAGELSRTGDMPFGPSYCTVDATPLFLVLLSEHARWTGNLELARELWPRAIAALDWLERFGDADGDGFYEYRLKGDRGLSNQGWKDSWDSIIHPDGTIARAPIALAEVQGYAYDAKVRMAELAERLGDRALSERLRGEGDRLKLAFNEQFWNEELGTFVVALDGSKHQVVSPTSNAGHCLWSGIADEDKAARVAAHVLSTEMFSGWGIRTMGADSPNYHPISYHNGTVWPHDNSLVVRGLARYGHMAGAAEVLRGLFEASEHFAYRRLPELFCGFSRDGRLSKPIPYPVACSPQAWAAGTPILLLQSVLGLEVDAFASTLRIVRPRLPEWAGRVEIGNLRVGRGSVDLVFEGDGESTTCLVLAQRGEVSVELILS